MSFWSLLTLVPKNLLSRLVGLLSRIRWPDPLRRPLLRAFAAHYRLDMSEAEWPLEHYPTIAEVFTRRLRAGARTIGPGPYVHPADSALTARGPIEKGQLIQAKGILYSTYDLLHDQGAADSVSNGHFLTYYLCPTDYHRVHSPVSGRLRRIQHISGNLWPVNKWSVENVPRLFAINERLIFHIESEQGAPVIVVMVGATNVGEMTTPWSPDLITNREGGREVIFEQAKVIQKGDELGVFHLGSTVVVLLGPNFPLKVAPGDSTAVKMGGVTTQFLTGG